MKNPMTPHSQSAPNPHWVIFWQRVRTAADELRRIEAEQSQGNTR